MRASEFIYFLQGWQEIGSAGQGHPAYLTKEQVRLIGRHIGLVKQCDWKDPSSQAHHFVSWLEGIIARDSERGISDSELPPILERLASIFKHEIDDSYPGTKGKKQLLQEIHDGLNDLPPYPGPLNDITYRC